MIAKAIPYIAVFLGSLALTLVLTPIVREINRKLGLVDKPDSRRINKVPIPRGGGVALFIGVIGSFAALALAMGESSIRDELVRHWRILPLAAATVAVGYADDKFSLSPKVKLAGQLVIAFMTWWWADLGFSDLWPSLPAWLDCCLTVFWIAGAINAFNLIDGLDGLASGLALIAALGMAGALFFSGHAQTALLHFSLAGGLLGFLRYNYNPASVFLGDSGSMYIGFTLAVLSLCSHTPDSFLVSVGVPLLAMGVPIFDTTLAILRRSIRHLLMRGGDAVGNGEVMTADTDHLHHRILRAVGLNQRRAAWTLYVISAFLVVVGLVGKSLESRASGLWLAALAVVSVIVVRDMARIELFDAGMLLNRMAHANDAAVRDRLARLAVPFYLACDACILAGSYVFCCWALKIPTTAARLRASLPIQVAATFGCLVFFRTYVTIWSRAVLSNYLRLFLACCAGSVAGSVAVYYLPSVPASQLKAMTISYAVVPFVMLMSVRLVRPVVRDLLYAMDCRRLVGRKDVSRLLVYGAGLRYRAFRRELVRSTAANDRMIVGLLDDDILLRGHYIGGCRVLGTLEDVPEVVNALNVDAVVITFDITEERLEEVRRVLKPTGVKVSIFSFGERTV